MGKMACDVKVSGGSNVVRYDPVGVVGGGDLIEYYFGSGGGDDTETTTADLVKYEIVMKEVAKYVCAIKM
jgi:hypothetical protein